MPIFDFKKALTGLSKVPTMCKEIPTEVQSAVTADNGFTQSEFNEFVNELKTGSVDEILGSLGDEGIELNFLLEDPEALFSAAYKSYDGGYRTIALKTFPSPSKLGDTAQPSELMVRMMLLALRGYSKLSVYQTTVAIPGKAKKFSEQRFVPGYTGYGAVEAPTITTVRPKRSAGSMDSKRARTE